MMRGKTADFTMIHNAITDPKHILLHAIRFERPAIYRDA